MPNMLDYLAWRGDLSIEQDPLNENDELILSQLAYVAFGDRVPGFEGPARVPLHEASQWLLSRDADSEQIHQTGYMWKNNRMLLQALQASRRFGSMHLFNAVDTISTADEKQFAAMCVEIGDGTTLITYRGTDDSLIGWKEDLNMAFACPVPAQEESVRYLHQVAEGVEGKLRLSGHSKGGNLAMYAAACCDDTAADRILTIVSHDGPGLNEKTIRSSGYARIRDRLRVYIPHFSFVGMLLEHENNYTVVHSDAKSVLQHDAFSWQMQGAEMLHADMPSERSLHTNRIIRQWIQTLQADEQRLFIEAAYEVASNAYGDTLPEDVADTNLISLTTSAQAVLPAVLRLEPRKRSLFTKGIGELLSTALKNIRLPWQKEDEAELDALMDTVQLDESGQGT